MSVNQRMRSEWGDGIVIEVPVPDTAKPGVPLAFGADGLYGIPETAKATKDGQLLGRAPASTRIGNASVQFPGIGQLRNLGAMPAGVAEYGKVYLSAAGVLTTTTTDLFVGYRYGQYVMIRNN